MGYRIVYDERGGKYEVKMYNPYRFWLFLGILLLVTLAFWQNGAAYIRDALIPGENQKTISAVQELAEGLRQGKGLREAVTAFCMDVIHDSVPAH